MVHQWGFFGSISAIRKIWSLTANSRSLQAAALKKYGLRRRGVTDKDEFDDTFCKVQRRMTELLNGSCSSVGYRTIWHILEMESLRIPRVIVQDLLREMNPADTELRKKTPLEEEKLSQSRSKLRLAHRWV